MKILVAHNSYQYLGGEDNTVAAERDCLTSHGHTVVPYDRHHAELRNLGSRTAVTKGIEAFWAFQSYRELKHLLAQTNPDIAHFHNTFPLISPSSYYACADSGVPVIQTLHNYRLICPGAILMRDGQVCEACLRRGNFLPAVIHKCYRRSFIQTTILASMLTAHRIAGTWQNKVTLYVALSNFARHKFVEAGLPANRVVVKPNFVNHDPGPKNNAGQYALFVGRLSEEKGIRVMLRAWELLKHKIPLYVIGDGPMQEELHLNTAKNHQQAITALGAQNSAQVFHWMRGASFLIVPSLSYEGFPLTIAEAFACGLPVIASRLGSLLEIVQDGHTGLHVQPGDAADLARIVEWAWAHENDMQQMGRHARFEFERKYSATQHYQSIMDIYAQALAGPQDSYDAGLRVGNVSSMT